jgi:hypothetical protein
MISDSVYEPEVGFQNSEFKIRVTLLFLVELQNREHHRHQSPRPVQHFSGFASLVMFDNIGDRSSSSANPSAELNPSIH